MIIIGAGMAGLLASAILRNNCEKIIEAQKSMPANHSAVLRFKSSIVGDTTNIPFRKVKAIKASVPWQNPIADALSYSKKSNGNYSLRSIVTSMNTEAVDRWVAPSDFTEQLASASKCEIVFNHRFTRDDLVDGKQFISTLPMPVLMDILDYKEPRPRFKAIPGINVMAHIKDCDMHCSLYVPDPAIGPYRISINGDLMIAEVALVNPEMRESVEYGSMNDNKTIHSRIDRWRLQALAALGVDCKNTYDHSFARQSLMKIMPIDETARRRFIVHASDNFSIYSLGRFAVWRPSLLLDDVVNDVRIVSRIAQHGNYEQRKEAHA